MTRILRFVTAVLTVAIFAGVPTAESKSNSKSKPKNKRLPVAMRKKMSSPFKLLTLEQFARLEYWRRVEYVKEMRKAVLDAERIQYQYRFGSKSAGLDQFKKSSDMYALLFGYEAHAQTGGRGRNVSDQCIYAFWLSNYGGDTRSGGQPYECERAQFGKCTPGTPVTSRDKAVGDGALCSMHLSGLDPRDTDNCIPRNIRYRATAECEDRRVERVNRYATRIKSANDEAKDYFKIALPESEINRADLLKEDAANLIKDLVDNSFDHEAWANLAYVAVLYKRAGIELPTKDMGYPYDMFTTASFDGMFTQDGVKINQLYKDYRAHCDDKVDDKEIQRLLESDCFRDSNGNITLPNWLVDVERRKCEAAKALDDLRKSGASQDEYFVKNILEIDECRIVDAVIAAREQAFDNIAGTYPDITDDAPGNDPIPPSAPKNEPDIVNTGCSSNVVRDEHLLFHPSARCLVCPAETTTRNTTSRKWFSLVSTMVLACGEGAFKQAGVGDGAYDYVTLQAMQKYLQTFGHCSQETYDWHMHSMEQKDFDLVRKWQTKSHWDKDETNCNKNPQGCRDFTRIYGISYDQATRLFCDTDRFKKRFFSGKIKGYDSKDIVGLDRLSTAELGLFMVEGRKRMMQEKQVIPSTDYHSPADALKACMDESLKVAEDHYSDSNNCIGFTRLESPGAFERMVNEVKNQEGVVLSDTGTCYNAKQHESFEGRSGVAFVDPVNIKLDYKWTRIFKASDQNGGVLPDAPMEVEPRREMRGMTNFSMFNVSYNNKAMCPITAGNYDQQQRTLRRQVRQQEKTR